MPSCLTINLHDLLYCNGVESARVEFKASWNQAQTGLQVLHTICAFANDFQNLNGGYLVIGVAERANGVADLPPKGLSPAEIDAAQQWIRGQCNRIDPVYQPILSPEVFEQKHILVIWAPGSDTRPHQVPETLSAKGEKKFIPKKYFIRLGSETVDTDKYPELKLQLLQMTARVPFDDRRALQASILEIRETKVREFLQDIHSDLVHENNTHALYRQMRIALPVNGHDVPRNIGLLCFSQDPEQWFRGTRIEVVHYVSAADGNILEEKLFNKRPILEQLQDCLDYLENLSVHHLQKRPTQMTAAGWVSYPSLALREALVNAVYHRTYDAEPEPIKVYLHPDRLEIISYQGPMPGIELAHLEGHALLPPVPARNRRVGEFLKELRLAEGRGTGLPKLRRAMQHNGSPAPRFDFDAHRSYFRVTLPAHPESLAILTLQAVAQLRALGEHHAVLERLQQAYAEVPNSLGLAIELQRELLQQGDLPAAIEIYTQFSSTHPSMEVSGLLTPIETAYLDRNQRNAAVKWLNRLDKPSAVHDIAVSAASSEELACVAALKTELNQRLGKEAQLWTRDWVRGNEVHMRVIQEVFAHTAAFVIVWSPRYANDCAAELEVILAQADAEPERLFVVEILDKPPRPESLAEANGYRFWVKDKSKHAQSFYGLNAQHPHYWRYHQGIERLAADLADFLQAAVDFDVPLAGQPVFLAPPRNRYFTGRGAVLTALAEGLTQQPMAVCGLGGLGKTQTLIEYAHRQRARYSAVLWVEATSAASLEAGWLRVAQAVGLRPANWDSATVQARVQQWLQTHSGWLLVLDNVEDLGLVQGWVSGLSDYGQVVFSTREATTRPVAEPVVLDTLSEAEGVVFLARRTGLTGDATAAELVALLGGLPLALEQAAAYVDVSQMDFAAYIQQYRTHGLALLAERGLPAHDADHPEPVTVTWLLSFEKVRADNHATIELLRYCAFLHSEGIPEQVLTSLIASEPFQIKSLSFWARRWYFIKRYFVRAKQRFRYQSQPLDGFDLETVLKPALRYSLLRREKNQSLLIMHRLVQTVLREQLSKSQQRVKVQQVVELLVNACPTDETDFVAWSNRQAEWLLNARAVEPWLEQRHLQSAATGTLYNQKGYCLQKMGNYAQALPLYQQALAIREQVLGQQHPAYATSLNNLAELYRTQGDYAQALPLFQQALAIYEQVLGQQHPDYASSLNNLAGVYNAQGDYAQALPLFQQALAIYEQVLGQQHPDYSQSLNNLAALYKAQGDYAQALPLFQQALAIREQVLGQQHPDYATSLNNLAELYRTQGDYAQALPLYQQALAIREQVLGQQHPDYANSLNNLAGLYTTQGDYAQALPLYQQALAIREQVLGQQHPDYANSLNNLAELHRTQGDYAQALPLFQQALAICTQALGTQHPHTQIVQNNYECCQAAVRDSEP